MIRTIHRGIVAAVFLVPTVVLTTAVAMASQEIRKGSVAPEIYYDGSTETNCTQEQEQLEEDLLPIAREQLTAFGIQENINTGDWTIDVVFDYCGVNGGATFNVNIYPSLNGAAQSRYHFSVYGYSYGNIDPAQSFNIPLTLSPVAVNRAPELIAAAEADPRVRVFTDYFQDQVTASLSGVDAGFIGYSVGSVISSEPVKEWYSLNFSTEGGRQFVSYYVLPPEMVEQSDAFPELQAAATALQDYHRDLPDCDPVTFNGFTVGLDSPPSTYFAGNDGISMVASTQVDYGGDPFWSVPIGNYDKIGCPTDLLVSYDGDTTFFADYSNAADEPNFTLLLQILAAAAFIALSFVVFFVSIRRKST